MYGEFPLVDIALLLFVGVPAILSLRFQRVCCKDFRVLEPTLWQHRSTIYRIVKDQTKTSYFCGDQQ
jgi:hypothetical protein